MIHLTDVTKTYKRGGSEMTPVKGFDMHVNKGETVILSGPSGSGKSTLLNITAGLIKPTEGLVTIAGRKISKLPEQFAALFRREHIGMIFQQFHLIEDITAAENIATPLLPTKLSGAEIKKLTGLTADRLGLTDRLNTPAGRLSGGEMQRTAIARALINSPSVILADEPTANLDTALTAEFISILRELKDEGKTIIIATHDPAVISSGIADRIISVEKGG